MADERLICGHCGETGAVREHGDGYIVRARCGRLDECKDDPDNPDCRTCVSPSRESAIAAWEKMWEHAND